VMLGDVGLLTACNQESQAVYFIQSHGVDRARASRVGGSTSAFHFQLLVVWQRECSKAPSLAKYTHAGALHAVGRSKSLFSAPASIA
jgi:hypothetical protein